MASLAQALTQALDASFPRMAFAMAYGSGVFQQKNHDASTSMIDLVFAVDDPVAWHEENIARNPHHYSFLRFLGAANVASFQVWRSVCSLGGLVLSVGVAGELWRRNLLQHVGTRRPQC
jgi:hypothetical protein